MSIIQLPNRGCFLISLIEVKKDKEADEEKEEKKLGLDIEEPVELFIEKPNGEPRKDTPGYIFILAIGFIAFITVLIEVVHMLLKISYFTI